MSKFYDHKLKYRTLDSLINSVADDFYGHDTESLIDPSQLIRVVRRINKQLSLRITRTKEVMIDFDNWVVNLPDDAETINFAILCSYHKAVVPAIQGTITENVDATCCSECDSIYITKCGDTYQVVQKVLPNLEYIFNIEKRIHIQHSMYQFDSEEIAGVILNDNFMRLTVKYGKIYLNYEGLLQDEDGNLLVLDHPLVNDYYEYSLKERILENMYFQGEDTERKLAYLQPKLKVAKREAYNVVNMPEFKEIQEVNELNREAMYKRYYSMFL